MKFSKLMLLCCGLVMSFSLTAAEKTKCITNTTYMGYEGAGPELSNPVLGHRFQVDNYIFDLNIGYTYFNTHYYLNYHWAKVGVNAYRTLYQTKNGQVYVGIGADFTIFKTTSWVGGSDSLNSFVPSVSIGNDFFIDKNKKVFFELTYKPYSFGKHERSSIHLVGYRMGIGF